MGWLSEWLGHSREPSIMSPRDRRLAADARAISELIAASSILHADAKGNPPSQYRFRFSGNGLALDPYGNVIVQKQHEVWIELGAAYPRMMPNLQWKTPIFHPNVSVNGIVCLGGYGTHWVPSLTLDELCNMIWDMIRMKNFDISSPYHREAAKWVAEQTPSAFPIDSRPLKNLLSAEPEVVQSSAGARLGAASNATASGDVMIVEAEVEVVRVRDSRQPEFEILYID